MSTRCHVMLDDEQARWLEAFAKGRGCSMAFVVREAVDFRRAAAGVGVPNEDFGRVSAELLEKWWGCEGEGRA